MFERSYGGRAVALRAKAGSRTRHGPPEGGHYRSVHYRAIAARCPSHSPAAHSHPSEAAAAVERFPPHLAYVDGRIVHTMRRRAGRALPARDV